MIGTWAKHVPKAYDRIAHLWNAERGAAGTEFRERRFLERLVEPLPAGAKVLDVGCGAGVPIASYLAMQGFAVTGLDASEMMLHHASQAVPTATFIHGDMRSAEPGSGFDAIVAWDSVFHLPRHDHAAVFRRFATWLRPGGRCLVSLGGSDADGFVSQMLGETFFYSGYDPAVALEMLEEAGFHVEHSEVDDPSSRGHIAVLAVRDGS